MRGDVAQLVVCFNSILEVLALAPHKSQAQVCDRSTREIEMGGHKLTVFLGYMIS